MLLFFFNGKLVGKYTSGFWWVMIDQQDFTIVIDQVQEAVWQRHPPMRPGNES